MKYFDRRRMEGTAIFDASRGRTLKSLSFSAAGIPELVSSVANPHCGKIVERVREALAAISKHRPLKQDHRRFQVRENTEGVFASPVVDQKKAASNKVLLK